MKQEILCFNNALKAYQDAIALVKKTVIEKLKAIPVNTINVAQNNSQIVLVPFSAIASSPTHSLEPFYYNIEAQKQKLIAIVENAKDLSFMTTFEQIFESKKLKVYTNGSYYYEHYNDETVRYLGEIVSEFSKTFEGEYWYANFCARCNQKI